jgi:hypothetical protein
MSPNTESKTELETSSSSGDDLTAEGKNAGKWSKEEHEKFLEAVCLVYVTVLHICV